MQTVEAQVSNARNQSMAIAEKLTAEGRAAVEITRANGDASVTQARIDAENSAKLSMVCWSHDSFASPCGFIDALRVFCVDGV